jgi:phospholipid/cholesterol/gamma-HCH transport system ATP-binding protein
MIELRDIHKSFGSQEVLRGFSLSGGRGMSVVFRGGCGSVKPEVIMIMVGGFPRDAGEVWVRGKRVDRLNDDEVDRVRLSIGYLFQGGALFDSMTVHENMDFILKRQTRLSAKIRSRRILETLEWVNIREAAGQYPAELSGGQKKRAGLARAIILKPDVLLYDEPTTGLDPVSVRTVSDLIVRLRDERNITSIAITHDMLCTQMIADEVHFLSEGRFIASGTLQEVRQSNLPTIRNFFWTDNSRLR